jgi:tetratricopeptide (TPR) repeat protein
MRQALGQLYVKGAYEALYELADKAIIENPNDAYAYMIKGRALVDQEKFKEAEQYLIKAADLKEAEPFITAWSLNYLGRIEFFKGNNHKAEEYLRECIDLNATANVTASANAIMDLCGLSQHFSNWENIATKNFIIHFQNESKVVDKIEFAISAQESFYDIQQFFTARLPRKIDLFVWNDAESAEENGLVKLSFSKAPISVIHLIAGDHPGDEIAHVVKHFGIEAVKRTRLIDEGLANIFDSPDLDKMQAAKEAKRMSGDDWDISVKNAWNDHKMYNDWTYESFAGALVKKLLKIGGKDRLLKLAADQSYENAQMLYGEDLDKIIEQLENEINSD